MLVGEPVGFKMGKLPVLAFSLFSLRPLCSNPYIAKAVIQISYSASAD